MLYLIAKSFYPIYAKMARQTVWNDFKHTCMSRMNFFILITIVSSECSDETAQQRSLV